MKVVMYNKLGCELGQWASLKDLLSYGYEIEFEVGDVIKFEDGEVDEEQS